VDEIPANKRTSFWQQAFGGSSGGKIRESRIKKDVRLGPQAQFGARSQSKPSLKGPYNWSQKPGTMVELFHGAEEEHGKECAWQLGAVSESVECEEG